MAEHEPDLSEFHEIADQDTLLRRIQSLEGQVARARLAPRQLKIANARIAELEQANDLLTAIDGSVIQPSRWSQPRASRSSTGIANLVLSDLHLDETIDPLQVNGRNAYSRPIAELRLRATIEKTVRLTRDYVTGVKCDGIQVWWGGDTVSGNIHDELRKTNAGQDVLDTIDYWSDRIAGALVTLADHFGHVRVVVVVGNHGRSTHKPEAKNAIRSSFDWLFARGVQRSLKADNRITWNIPESLTVQEQVLGTRYHFEHGDNFKGGDQIAGPIRPVMMGFYRRQGSGDPFDRIICGHFHQYASIPQAICNGSLIGYSEYSLRRGYRPEPPRQAFWIETAEHGAAFSMPIQPANPQKEGWA